MIPVGLRRDAFARLIARRVVEGKPVPAELLTIFAEIDAEAEHRTGARS